MKRSSVGTQMANYSHIFQETIDEFVSPLVPGDQGDNGKGQVTARAGYKIHLTNPNVGYIGKNPGQTQYHGIAVDALTDRSDGTGADYLTDILQGDGTRLIAVAYTPYPHQNVPPEAGWVEPTEVYLTYPGPLTLKSTDPVEPPVPNDDVILARLDDIITTQAQHTDMLSRLQEQQAADTATTLAAIADFRAWVNSLVDDLEDFVNKLGKLIWLKRRPDEPEDTP